MLSQLITYLRSHFRPAEGTLPHDKWDYLHQFGDVFGALLYAPLFCPSFVEVDGSVLLDQGIEESAKNFAEAKLDETFPKGAPNGKSRLQRIESAFNFIEVPYIFQNRDGDDGEKGLLAQFIAEAWRGRLALLYPSRRFEVVVLDRDANGELIVEFFEVR